MENLKELFLEELQDVYDAEKQLVKALPKLAAAASNPKLKTAFENHLKETKGHVENLEKAFEVLEEKIEAKPCKAMKGLIAEANDLLKEEAAPEVLDAALIAAAQKVEHYEIASYGALAAWAKQIDEDEVVTLLKQNLAQEKAADTKLSKLAEAGANAKAAK
jgi:ferritin-like metal-binding protein YciE